MRLQLYPGPDLWYKVSITGTFLVPFCIYNFVYHFTDSRAPFSRTVHGVAWAVVVLLNLHNIFITDPHIVTVGDKNLSKGLIEYKERKSGEISFFPVENALEEITARFACAD